MQRSLANFCHLAVFALGLSAWTHPELPTPAKPTKDGSRALDYVIFLVNGEPRRVPKDGELTVIYGDHLMVKDAALSDKTIPILEVNVVGYKSPGKRAGEDRNFPFTTTDLEEKYSEGHRGERYAVLATTQGELHGAVYLKLIAPVLRYAEIAINNQVRILRDGEPLVVKAHDQVKVKRVVTNLESADGVLFHIAEEEVKGTYKIRFERGGHVFAEVPLKVEP